MTIKAEQITVKHAEDVYDGKSTTEDDGRIQINGETVEWWSDAERVWFYEPGNDGDDTLKKFDVNVSISEAWSLK